MTYSVDRLPDSISIGWTGTENQISIDFDISKWREKWPGAVFKIVAVRPGETEDDCYICETTMVGDILTWNVLFYDVAKNGEGSFQIHAEQVGEDHVYARSNNVTTVISKSSTADGSEAPETSPWLQAFMEKAAAIEELVVHTPVIGENGLWMFWDEETQAYVASENDSRGEKGDKGDPGKKGDKGDPGDPTEPIKIADYLYLAETKWIDYDFAKAYFEQNRGGYAVNGGCSAVFRDGKFGRNFDWMYNEQASYVIETSDTIGVAASLPDGFDRRLLPFYTMDGVNVYGLTAATLVVPSEGLENVNVPTEETRESICGTMFVRYVLDNFRTVAEAVNYISKYVEVWFPDALHEMGYEAHWMLADKTGASVIVEILDGQVKTVETDAATNFYLDGVTFNEDGKLYSPATLSEGSPTVQNGVTPHGSGLERYNIIAGWTGNVPDLMDELMYTKTYTDLLWHTEFVGGALRCDSSVADFENIETAARNAYERRTRADQNPTWQTVHSAIYDVDKLELNISVQEIGVVYGFTFDKVISVNGMRGAVEIDAGDVLVDKNAETPETVKEKILAQNETIANKLTEPSSGLAVGKWFRVASIDADGHAVLEAVDAPECRVEDVLVGDVSAVQNKVAKLEVFNTNNKNTGMPALVRTTENCGFTVYRGSHDYFALQSATTYGLDLRGQVGAGGGRYGAVTPSNFDYAVKAAMSDGVGAAWTDAEKSGAWQRITSIKSTMDSVAVAGAAYYLGELSSLTISMPTDALLGQSITVVFSSGATACTLTCDLAGFDFVPKANKTNKLVFTLIHKADASITGDTEKWSVETEES